MPTGLLVAAAATGGCFVAGAGPDDPDVGARDGGVDAGGDAEFVAPSGGGPPFP